MTVVRIEQQSNDKGLKKSKYHSSKSQVGSRFYLGKQAEASAQSRDQDKGSKEHLGKRVQLERGIMEAGLEPATTADETGELPLLYSIEGGAAVLVCLLNVNNASSDICITEFSGTNLNRTVKSCLQSRQS